MVENVQMPKYIPGWTTTLRAERVKRKMNVEAVMEAIGVSKNTVYRWERGESFPNAEQIKKLQSLYGVNYNNIKFTNEKL